MVGSSWGLGAGRRALEWVLQIGRGRGPGRECDKTSHEWSLGALEWVLQSSRGSEWVLTTSFEIKCIYVLCF